MRDKERIPEICNRLAEIWSKVPDWRLSQLMMNAILTYHQTHSHSIFYLEDSNFIEYLEEYVKDAK